MCMNGSLLFLTEMVFDIKGLVMGKPPQVIFVVCLGAFAIILMSFAYHVQVSKLANPDISEDWNIFLQNFTQLGFCIMNQNDGSPPATLPTTDIPDIDTDIQIFSVSMVITVTPTRDFINTNHNLTHLAGTVLGEQLGMQGPNAQDLINISMQLPVNWNETICKDAQKCDVVTIYGCVNFYAEKNVFPESRSPKACYPKNDTGIEYYARIRGDKLKGEAMYEPIECKSQPHIKLSHTLDPTLTVYLSLGDKSVINLHLMHTSYFLFVMVVTLLVYALLKGHRTKGTTHNDMTELLNHTDS